jgi:hypothetical protein
MSTVTDSDSVLARRSIDALLERYVSWREQCAAVRWAYQSWACCDRDERTPAYARYVAALDREEHAARVYAEQVGRVSKICT